MPITEPTPGTNPATGPTAGDLTLVVMAAGVGSRFGGTKQLAAVGPTGEAILDYTIHDARRAGFERVVVIVRREIEAAMAEHLRSVHGADLDLRLVCQDADPLAPPRAKPWGTGHAILTTRELVETPFIVVNADDFYGAGAFATLASALRVDAGPADYHLVAYRLDRTLSPLGTVSRGVCTVDAEGRLLSIVEHLAIARSEHDGRIRADGATELAPDTPVSMNLWGLRPGIFAELHSGFAAFVAAHEGEPKAEYLLPQVIGAMVADGRATVRVHRSDDTWLGVTYPGDLPDAQAALAKEIAAGHYPSPLRA